MCACAEDIALIYIYVKLSVRLYITRADRFRENFELLSFNSHLLCTVYDIIEN